jgi:hypothetical protein
MHTILAAGSTCNHEILEIESTELIHTEPLFNRLRFGAHAELSAGFSVVAVVETLLLWSQLNGSSASAALRVAPFHDLQGLAQVQALTGSSTPTTTMNSA